MFWHSKFAPQTIPKPALLWLLLWKIHGNVTPGPRCWGRAGFWNSREASGYFSTALRKKTVRWGFISRYMYNPAMALMGISFINLPELSHKHPTFPSTSLQQRNILIFNGQWKWNCLRSSLVWIFQPHCPEEPEAGEVNHKFWTQSKTELSFPNLQLSLILLLSSQELPGELAQHLIQFIFCQMSVAAPS